MSLKRAFTSKKYDNCKNDILYLKQLKRALHQNYQIYKVLATCYNNLRSE